MPEASEHPTVPVAAPDEPATFAPPVWVRLMSNLTVVIGAGILVMQGTAVGGGTLGVALLLAAGLLAVFVRSFLLRI